MSDREKPVRDLLTRALEHDFEVFEKCKGRHKHGGERIYYDLVLKAKEHIIERGFDAGYFIIEVKLFNDEDAKKHDIKARDLLWQCVAYSFSEIELSSGVIERPLFVLYFIAGDGIDPEHEEEWRCLHHFVQRGGVGRLMFEPKKHDWVMYFGGTRYFSKVRGRSVHNVGIKRQTGSSR